MERTRHVHNVLPLGGSADLGTAIRAPVKAGKVRRMPDKYRSRRRVLLPLLCDSLRSVCVNVGAAFVLLPRHSAPIEKNTPFTTQWLFYVLETVSESPFRSSDPRRPRFFEATFTFFSRHSRTLAHNPSTFSAFRALGTILSLGRTHRRWSLILNNCIFYCSYKIASHIGHFICKLPKNNVANARGLFGGSGALDSVAECFHDGSTFGVCAHQRHGSCERERADTTTGRRSRNLFPRTEG